MMRISMAKKAKRRGRPPGSKNKKKSIGRLTRNVARMEVSQLRDYINSLEETLAARIQQQREILEGQLAGLRIAPGGNDLGRAVFSG
jgi:hypothetical protein